MRKALIKALEAIKKTIYKLIDIIFKKVEDEMPDDLWARWYGPMEADPRDFKVENILWKIDKSKIKDNVDLLKEADNKLVPVYQWCVPSCTASALTNYITLQEAIERNKKLDFKVEIDWIKGAKRLRSEMGHKWVCKWEHGDYLEHALKLVRHNKLLAEITYYNPLSIKDEYLWITGYAYANATADNMKYWLSMWYPLYFAFRGNKNTRTEMALWEIKTYNFTPTGWHAVTAYWYDEDYLYFINSWEPNDWTKYEWEYAVFKIKWGWLMEMVRKWLANWRFWIVYNVDDNLDSYKRKMFVDYKINGETEQGQAVKYFTEKKIIKWVPKEDWRRLEPNRPVTRLELIVILYRFLKTIINQDKS